MNEAKLSLYSLFLPLKVLSCLSLLWLDKVVIKGS